MKPPCGGLKTTPGLHFLIDAAAATKLDLVPTVRLELTRLSPPPPQDGVSTNSTTSARCKTRGILLESLALRGRSESEKRCTAHSPRHQEGLLGNVGGLRRDRSCRRCRRAGASGTTGAGADPCGAMGTGMSFGAVFAGAGTESMTPPVPPVGRLTAVPAYASPSVATKNTVATAAVLRDRKFAEPVAPKRLPEAPPPNAAPMSAPLPCCRSTRTMIAIAESTCTTISKVVNQVISRPFSPTSLQSFHSERHAVHASRPRHAAAIMRQPGRSPRTRPQRARRRRSIRRRYPPAQTVRPRWRV